MRECLKIVIPPLKCTRSLHMSSGATTRRRVGMRITFMQISQDHPAVSILPFSSNKQLIRPNCSYSGLHCAQGPTSQRLEITKCVVQNDILNDCYAVAQRLGRLHIYLLRPRCQVLKRRAVQEYDRPFHGLRSAPSPRSKGRGMVSWRARRHSR